MPSGKVFVAELNKEPQYQRLLPGEPETCGMKAGRVYLEAGEECGRHNTEDKEEMLTFLSGNGQVVAGEDEQPFAVGAGRVCYIPPDTLHNVKNTGVEPLIYVYCVAPVQ